MKCPKCGSEKIRALIHVLMYIDAKHNHHLSKAVINKKTTQLYAQDHDKTSYCCIDCLYAYGPLYEKKNE